MSVELQNENNQLKVNMKALMAQLDAAKQMITEGLTTNLQLRTNLLLFQQAGQETARANADLQTELQKAKAEIQSLAQQILELEKQVPVTQPDAAAPVSPEASETPIEEPIP
jgi:soluble cytochrome b562